MKPRSIHVVGDVAYVPLTHGYQATINAADVPLIQGANWHAHVRRRRDGTVWNVYAIRNTYGTDGAQRRLWMHRVILGAQDGLTADHIDGDGLNNRRSNLRSATVAENTQNRRIHNNNKTGLKGVSWHQAKRRWRAKIMANGRQIYLGTFSDPVSAAEAYAKASAELHGQFGRVA